MTLNVTKTLHRIDPQVAGPSSVVPPQSKPSFNMDLQLFGHIFLDAFIKNSGLEGGYSTSSINYLKQALANLKDSLPQEDRAKIDEIIALFDSFKEKISFKDISSMKIGQKLLFGGGWHEHKGIQGHAMLYLFEKNSDNTFNITIFNSGEGAQFHGESSNAICPVKQYFNVPKEKITEDVCTILSKILSPYWDVGIKKKYPNTCLQSEFSKAAENIVTYLYLDLFTKWDSASSKEKQKSSLRMKGQKSGTCSYRAPLSLVKSYLSPKGYKLFKYYSKRDAFFQFYQQCQENNALSTPQIALAIKNAGEKLLRSMAKLYLPDNVAELLLSKEEVEKTSSEITQILHGLVAPAQDNLGEEQISNDNNNLCFNPPKTSKLKVSIQTAVPSTRVPVQATAFRESSFATDLTNFVTRLEKYDTIDSFEIEKITRQFPLPNDKFWQNIPKGQILPILEQLYKLLLIYYKCTKNQPLRFLIEKQNVVLSIYSIMFALSLRRDEYPKLLAKAIADLKDLVHATPFVCFDKNAWNRNRELKAFLEKPYSSFFARTEHYTSYYDTSAYLGAAVKQDAYFLRNKDSARDKVLERNKDIEKEDVDAMSSLIAADDVVLNNSGLEHFRLLRQARALTDLFCSTNHKLQNIQIDTTTPVLYSYCEDYLETFISLKMEGEGSSSTRFKLDSYQDSLSPAFSLHRNVGALRDLYKEEVDRAEKDTYFLEGGTEGYALTKTQLLLERELLSNSGSSQLKPSEILAYFRRNFSLLTPTYQTIFDVLLFKLNDYIYPLRNPPPGTQGQGVAIFEEAQKETFIEQSIAFINEGLECCFDRHVGKIDVHKALFFIRFCDRMKTINPRAPWPQLNDKLEDLLKLPYLNEFEKRAIHLHRIFHYSTMAAQDINEEILNRIFVSWFYYNNYPPDLMWDDPYMYWQAQNFVISLAPILENKLKTNPSFKDAFLSNIIAVVLKQNPLRGVWQGTFPLFQSEELEISLLKGQIFKNHKLYSSSCNTLTVSDASYQKLFSGQLFDYTLMEDGFVGFEHPQYGSMKMRQLETGSLEILRKINDKWCKYFTSQEMETLFFGMLPPRILSGQEYACFVAVEEEGAEDKICVYITPLDTSVTPSYQFIYTKASDKYKVEAFALDANYKPQYKVNLCSLPRFENHGFVLEDLTTHECLTTFPRYRSFATGQTLGFVGTNMEWEENRSFTLQKTKPQGLLGGIGNHYLFLRDEKTKREKILVPLQRVLPNESRIPTTSHLLDFKSHYKHEQEDGKVGVDFRAQIGIFNYLEFDVDNGKIIPLSIEGALFKVYLALLERDYEGAKLILNSLPNHENLSKVSLEILKWIQEEGRDAADFSPSAAAIRLSAALLDREHLQADQLDVSIYQKSYSSTDVSVRLSSEEMRIYWIWENGPLHRYDRSRRSAQTGHLALEGAIDPSFRFFQDYFIEDRLYEDTPPATWQFPTLSDSAYADSEQKEYDAFRTNYQKGYVQNSHKTKYTLKREIDFATLQVNLNKLCNEQKQSLDELRGDCLLLANRQSSNSDVALKDALLTQGNYFAPLDMNDLINLFLLGDFEKYAEALSYLTSKEIEELDFKIQQFLLKAIKVQKLERAQALSTGQENCDSLASELIKDLAHSTDDRDLLVFQYRANIMLRADQVRAISKMLATDKDHLQNLTLQMMMGGGKTSVLASILLYKASRKRGRLAVFIPPTAQFETLHVNLGRMQKRYFKQEVLPVKLSREELTLANLLKLKLNIEETIESQGILLITKETLQTLELELLYILEHFSTDVAQSYQDNLQKIECLQSILRQIRERGDFLIDESDIMLNPNIEVNLPSSTPSKLQYELLTLITQIYKLHISQEIAYKGRSVGEIIGLTRNEQSSLDISFYQKELQPLIAKKLLNVFPSFATIPLAHQEACVRYICAQMQSKSLSAKDQAFLDYLKALSKGSEEDKKLADQIAFAKFIFSKILPLALTRNTGRNYGRTPQHPNGKVVPFLGVDTPNPTTEFGSPWMAAAYHFQTALTSVISLVQVKNMVQHFASVAEHEAKKNHCKVDETIAAKRFALATNGKKISELAGNDEKIEQLLQEINSNVNLKLIFEQETVAEVVQYYSAYFGSNAQDFVLQCNTVRTFSGTPENAHCYGRNLDRNVLLEEGVEGSIVDQMLRQAKDKQLVHEITETSIETVLNTCKGKRVQCLMDAGGIFKNFSNEAIARDLAQHFKDDPKVEYVLFFGRKEASDTKPDHLMAFKRNCATPIYIGSTRKEELEKRGITRDNTFAYFDEQHCEATDLPLSHKSTGILTMSSRMDLRTQLQGIMRMREFFKEQTVEYVFSSSEKALFLQGGQSVQDCVLTFLTNQAKQKTDQAFRSAKQRIRALFREHIFTKILTTYNCMTIYKQHSDIFKDNFFDSPYNDYGALDDDKEVKEALLEFTSAELAKLPNLPEEERKQLETKAHQLIEDEIAKGRLPKTVLSSDFNGDLQVEMEREVEVVLETEMQRELERYNFAKTGYSFEEKEWQTVDIEHALGISQVPYSYDPSKHYGRGPEIYSFATLLQTKRPYSYPYETLFDDNIFMSQNWALTYSEYTSIFHSSQKRADQILIVRNPTSKKLSCFFLSKKEALFFKEWLEDKKYKNAWLYLSDGSRAANNPKPVFAAAEKDQIDRMLLQANIVNGNADYLDAHEKDLKAFIKEKGEALLLRFLKLKVENDAKQRAIFYDSVIKIFKS